MRWRGLAGSFSIFWRSRLTCVSRVRVSESSRPHHKRVEADLARHDLTQSRREERQEVELLATEFDLFAASDDGSTNEVDAQVTERDDLTRRCW